MDIEDYLPPNILASCDTKEYTINGVQVEDDGVREIKLADGHLLMTGMSIDSPIPGWLESSHYVKLVEWR